MLKNISFLVLASLMLSGCGSMFSSRAAENTMVVASPAFEGLNENQEAFGYLSDEFRENNSFTDKESQTLAQAEGALLSEFTYLQEITTVAGSVPYYEYVASYKRIKRNVKIMGSILDAYIQEYPRSTQIIYSMTRGNIAYLFHVMNTSIYTADEEISGREISTVITQFSQLYKAVKPLISTATATAVL